MNTPTLTFEMLQEAMKAMLKSNPEPPVFIVSPKAYDIALKIQKDHPELNLLGEATIWYYAHKYGYLK